MMKQITNRFFLVVSQMGDAIYFLMDVLRNIFKGRVRFNEVLKQSYEQGWQSAVIVALTSFASGAVLALQGHVVLSRLGAKEYIAQLVALSLLREMSPVFTAIIFSAKAGARITAELGTMSVNDQILATRTMGVDPMEFLVVPRFLACFLVLPILTLISEIVGILGGYFIGVYQANIPGVFYINQTINAVRFVDFFSGFIKVFFFAILIGWICCSRGFTTKGGSLGVGKYTTEAVAQSIILVIIFNTILTKIILTFWG
ncbi:MAG TPA: ABC transporter permease [Candidatus Omnitrophota bacterium]|nr:ABC transporter permease [Candidatus Omnitrophota bacterium]